MDRSEFRIAGKQSGSPVAVGQQQLAEESGLCSKDKGKLLRHLREAHVITGDR